MGGRGEVLGPGKRLEVLGPGKQGSLVGGYISGKAFVPLSQALPARGQGGLTAASVTPALDSMLDMTSGTYLSLFLP